MKTLFSGCELLDGFDIRCGFLTDKCKSVSIVPEGDCSVIRLYSDGEKIVGETFKIIIRLVMNEENSENLNFLNSLSDWIRSVKVSEFISDTCHVNPVGITLIQSPVLEDDDIHSGKYTIKIRLDTII
ncbi:MAG: hypothetical protein IJD30_03390 [Clostridia bacterium]|nr:hypothetical protein [Clostridia bacterium]